MRLASKRMRRGAIVATAFAVAALAAFAPSRAMAADGDFLWVHTYGNQSWTEVGRDVVVDPWGNVFGTGSFGESLDVSGGIGTGALAFAGGSDAYVFKLDRHGALLWARAMGGTSSDGGQTLAVDAAGNVYVAGYFSLTGDFDPGAGVENLTSAGAFDVFIVKLNPQGNLVWARSVGGAGGDNVAGIALDGAGAVHVTGTYRLTADFDPGPGIANLTSAGNRDVFVLKLDANGDFLWVRGMGGNAVDEPAGIAVDNAGRVHVAGRFEGTASFQPPSAAKDLIARGRDDVFVWCLNSDGSHAWAHALGGESVDIGLAMAVDPGRAVYVSGRFSGTADFDPGPEDSKTQAVGWVSAFVVKLDTQGNFVWVRAFGGPDTDSATALAVDSRGNVLVGGGFESEADLDPGPATRTVVSVGGRDVFLLKLNADGEHLWSKGLGGLQGDDVYALAVDPWDRPHVAGGYHGTVDFDPGPGIASRTAVGGLDAFLLKLAGPPESVPPNAIAIAPETTGPTDARTLNFTVEFDEPVDGFDSDDDLIIAHLGTTHAGATISGGPVVYNVRVFSIGGEGSFTLAVDTSSNVVDFSGNPLASSVTSAPVQRFEPEGEAEGVKEGEGGGEGEGMKEGEGDGGGEGADEGGVEGEGTVDGEGGKEGEGPAPGPHSADQNGNGAINLSELLRVIQFYNSSRFGCEPGTEDGYEPNRLDEACQPHASDYNPKDWKIQLTELLRLIQFYNGGGYHPCPDNDTEDGYCPGAP